MVQGSNYSLRLVRPSIGGNTGIRADRRIEPISTYLEDSMCRRYIGYQVGLGTYKQPGTNGRAIRQVDQRPAATLDLGLNRFDLDFLQQMDALQRFEVAKEGALQVQVFGQSCHLTRLGSAGSRGKFRSIKDDACIRNAIPNLHHSCISWSWARLDMTCLHLSYGTSARIIDMCPRANVCTEVDGKSLSSSHEFSPSKKALEVFVIELTRFENVSAGSDQSRILDKSPASMSAILTDSRTNGFDPNP